MRQQQPEWISLIYAPAHDGPAVLKALASNAHAVIFDLEDFVPSAQKSAARNALAFNARQAHETGKGSIVRINRRLDLAVADIEVAVCKEVDAIMITKAANAEHIVLLDEWVSELEGQRGLDAGRIKFIAMIETADAVANIKEIARSTPRMIAMNIGAEDIAKEMHIPSDSPTLFHIKENMIVSAFAAGISPWGHNGSVKTFGSGQGFTELLQSSKTLGFRSATCLTADQVEYINLIYTT